MFFEKLSQMLSNAFRPKPKYITVTPVASGPVAALPPARMPRHVAIIMDGNGRWAKQRGMSRSAGHAAGTEALRDIIRASDDWGIEALSLYAFSTENWARSKEEVDALMGLLLKYFASEIDELDEKNVRIKILGDVDGLPQKQREAVLDAMERTKDNSGLKLNIAINYGGRAELVRAARSLAQKALDGEVMPAAIDEDAFAAELYSADSPDVDLLIRTSGEKRISNFLPWQLSYAEFIFDDILWPDFDRDRYMRCLREYAGRERRYGLEEAPEEPQTMTEPAAPAPAPEAREDAALTPEPAPEPEPAPAPEEPEEETSAPAAQAAVESAPETFDGNEVQEGAEDPGEGEEGQDPDEGEGEDFVLNITPMIFPREAEETPDTTDEA